MRKSQSKNELFKKKPLEPVIESETKFRHFPRPSAEFRYKQEFSDEDRSSLGGEMLMNGLIIEKSPLSNKKSFKNFKTVNELETFEIEVEDVKKTPKKHQKVMRKSRSKEISAQKSDLKKKALKKMQKSRKGRWREMLSSGKKKSARKTLKSSNKKKNTSKDNTPSKSMKKSKNLLFSSSKKNKSGKKLFKKGRESISSNSRKLAKEMILKSFRKKTQDSFMKQANDSIRAFKTMGESTHKKTRVAKIDLKNLKMLTQLAQKPTNSGGKNDYFF